MPIRLLPPDLAARIAAGEVVERPASVVKELVENALDAGATRVGVEVRGGGLELLRVVDNGQGIPPGDTELLFRRHATSKLHSPDDLEAIATLGFRGEALYAIGSVAWVVLVTRHRDSPQGVLVEVRDGRVVRRGPCGAPPGTQVAVRRLFANFPARRKFLRSPLAEAGRAQAVVALYAMAFPQVQFSLQVEERPALLSPGGGSLREAVSAVHGAEVAQALLEAQGGEGPVRVWGLVSPPGLHRAGRGHIAFFVNRRPVQSRLLLYALEQAYHGFLPQGRHPVAVLHLQLPPEEVDVNVHPAKAEVRFRREEAVFTALQRAVRTALMASAPVTLFQIAPAGPAQGVPLAPPSPGAPRAEAGPQAAEGVATIPPLRVVGQAHLTYIVAEGPEGLYLVDQHAAHERVLYEEVRGRARRGEAQVQGLLEPVAVELPWAHSSLVEAQGELLARYGWALEPFGERAWLVRGLPRALGSRPPAQALLDLLDALVEEGAPAGMEERLAATIACHGAVRAGDPLTQGEMEALLQRLAGAEQPHTCPHGRPTIVHLSTAQLEREFRRR